MQHHGVISIIVQTSNLELEGLGGYPPANFTGFSTQERRWSGLTKRASEVPYPKPAHLN